MVSALEMVVGILPLEHPAIDSDWVTLNPPNHSTQASFLSPHWHSPSKDADVRKLLKQSQTIVKTVSNVWREGWIVCVCVTETDIEKWRTQVARDK